MSINSIVWLEVDRSNQAIMSYYLEQPSDSSRFDYVEVTEAELTVLNVIEDNLLSRGMIVTLSDLYAHRELVQAARDKAARLAVTAPQKAAESASGPTPPTPKQDTGAGLKAAIKRFRNRK